MLAVAAALSVATTAPAAHAAPSATLDVDVAHTTSAVNDYQFGHIVEDINHSVEGGLSANVVRNSTMKENGNANPPSHWSAVGGATISGDDATPLNAANARSLRIDVTESDPAQRAGTANSGFYGIGVRPDTAYQVSFWARASADLTGPLTLSLESNAGTVHAETTVTGVTAEWQEFTATLTTGASALVSKDNRFVVATTGDNAGKSLWLNVVRVLGPTFAPTGGIRKDLQQKLADTKPGFIRVPGGNYLEGVVLENRFKWKETIGKVEDRPGHQNDAWGYWSTDQFGLLSYLLMAEQAGAEPMLGVFAGYTLNGQSVPQDQLAPYVQEALDQIEYVIGDVNTPWGAKRAEDGHPEPFPLKYVEVGNEDWFDPTPSYNTYRYPMFYDAIKAKYPHLQIVASMGVTSRPMDVIDDHYYNGNPDSFAALGSRYDSADRNGPKVLVGEYGVTNGSGSNPTGTLSGALAEAVFLAGTVRNSDVVIGSAYAPALTSVDKWQWSSNMIGFDAVSSYGSPSYHVVKMFGEGTGDHVVPSTATGTKLDQVVTRNADGTVYMTVVNRHAAPVETRVNVKGAQTVGSKATVKTLTGDPNARNSITAPDTVAPTESRIKAGRSFVHTFPANSMTVLTLTTKSTASPILAVDRSVSLRTTTGPNLSLTHQDDLAVTSEVTVTSDNPTKLAASFILRRGLADADCYSFESRQSPGHYLRGSQARVRKDADDGSTAFKQEATFCATYGNSGSELSFSWYPDRTRFLRTYDNEVWLAGNGGPLPSDNPTNWAADTTWKIADAWWRSRADVPTGLASLKVAASADKFLRHSSNAGFISAITDSSPELDKQDATFDIVPGHADSSCYSLRSRNFPDHYLRHRGFRVEMATNDGTPLFAADSTFCAQPGNGGEGVSWQSINFSDRYLRAHGTEAWISHGKGGQPYDDPEGWARDTTWTASAPWAP
ncbi:AbfB domain-containing protein [Saccharothrix isguenensis]